MVSSIWKPEMVMYLSNTAKQSVLGQWTAHIPASPPLSSGQWHLCVIIHSSGATGHSLTYSEHPFPIRCPLYNPSLHLEGTAPMHYSQWAKQLGKRMGKQQGEKGLSLLAAQSMHLKMGWAFPGWISGRSFQPLINHTTYPSSSGKRCGFPRWWWTFLHLFPISAPQLWTKPVMNSGDQNISICFTSCWKALFVSL